MSIFFISSESNVQRSLHRKFNFTKKSFKITKNIIPSVKKHDQSLSNTSEKNNSNYIDVLNEINEIFTDNSIIHGNPKKRVRKNNKKRDSKLSKKMRKMEIDTETDTDKEKEKNMFSDMIKKSYLYDNFAQSIKDAYSHLEKDTCLELLGKLSVEHFKKIEVCLKSDLYEISSLENNILKICQSAIINKKGRLFQYFMKKIVSLDLFDSIIEKLIFMQHDDQKIVENIHFMRRYIFIPKKTYEKCLVTSQENTYQKTVSKIKKILDETKWQ